MSRAMETRRTADSHKPVWHWYHKEGDICLRSTDGVRFGADKWRLTRASEFFQGMLEIASPNPMRPPRRLPHLTSDDINPDTRPNPADCTSSSIIDTTENTKRDLEDISSEPLDLDMESELLDAFLNLINSSHPYVHQLSFQHSSELLRQCDKLICNLDICNAVKQRLYEWGVTMPWELLVLASERDDVNLGRIALKSMDSSIFINEMSWYNFRATPQEMIPLRSRPFWERMGM
ncbi:hypothetical protein L486_02161 [Kwoniella mangroviensis CBS 10435]|uniref:BTB domain-containing protein n=1 Tax=Kwoniella mangroviensis CBS 10435 TaxID=1331196 RepID=A0A1B9IVQ2_9TREE|nr:hypothetical protein L486_02161 [Kwoniella mangroviensis CBS 10435]